MKEIDRRGRTIFRLIMWGAWLMLNAVILLAILTSEPTTDTTLKYYGIVLIVLLNAGYLVAIYFTYRTTPRVYVSKEGIYHKPFFRKYFTPWSEIGQAMILKINWNTGRRGYYYRFVLLKKTASYWYRKDTARIFLERNKEKYLYIPLTDESREYVEKQGIRIVRDETDGRKVAWIVDK